MCRFHSLLLECCECNVKCVVEVCLPNSRLLTTHSVNITHIQAYNTFFRHILLTCCVIKLQEFAKLKLGSVKDIDIHEFAILKISRVKIPAQKIINIV